MFDSTISKPSLIAVAFATLLQGCNSGDSAASEHQVDGESVVKAADAPPAAEVLTDQLEQPWGMAMLPDERILITEKPGRLRLLDLKAGRLSEPLSGLPAVAHLGQGGLLDVALHPNFAENQLVYLSYSAGSDGQYGTEVGRGRFTETGLEGFETLFVAQPKVDGGAHFGSRLVFDRQGYLFITLGDRGRKEEAQKLSSHLGSIVRLHDNGAVPTDNPFLSTPGAKPEIYSYGHRNIQGADLNPWTGELWAHEHGPQGGDEVNIIKPGANYGWPTITYGVNYGIGTAIGEGTEKAGMEQPLYYWDPSIAPSGMAFYDHAAIAQWQGDLLVGALKFQLLAALDVDGRDLSNERRLYEQQYGRIREVEVSDSGDVYLLTDSGEGKLIRISAAN